MSTKNSGIESTDPAINNTLISVRERSHSSESVVSVQDAESFPFLQQDDGLGQSSCTCDKGAATSEAGFCIYDICISCRNAAYMLIKQTEDSPLRGWVEACEREGHFVPFPREIADRLDTMTVEHVEPSSLLRSVVRSVE